MSDVPSFAVEAILTRRNRLFDQVCLPWLQVELTGENLENFGRQLRSCLPAGIPQDAVRESLRSLAGEILTPELGRSFAWTVAGNLGRLQAGFPVALWRFQEADEWVPVAVVRAEVSRNQRNESGFNYRFRILAGTPAGQLTGQFWSRKQITLFARELGFSGGRGKYLFQDPRQFVRLRMVVEILAERGHEQPFFWQLRCPPSMLEYNRQILAMRYRYVPCPENFTHACHVCTVGFTTCRAGCHQESYELRYCTHCQKESWFDPEDPLDRCIECHNHWRLRPRT